MPLLRQVELKLKLASSLAACAREWCDPLRVEYPPGQLFSQRIFACVDEDGNDQQTLREDSLLQLCACLRTASIENAKGSLIALRLPVKRAVEKRSTPCL